MIENFPQLRQATGSNSCLPTAVRAVLRWQGQVPSQEDVSEWCQEGILGCLWTDALDGLADAGFTVDEIRERTEADAWERLREIVDYPDDPQPVIVTLQMPFRDFNGDHAVVVIGIISDGNHGSESVTYMDPLSGGLERVTKREFVDYWNMADSRAFVITP